ncbi:MAG: methionine ABC transporter substrate-binding protein, partial [Acidaminococcaceae bacterium]|nr:methionine ABC transporter substrate-binding protein [Acidaminococcaceae bacterium]
MKKFVLLISILILAVSLVGCGGDTKKAEKPAAKEIKIGATAGPHAQVVEAVAKEGKKQGLDIKVIEFSDYITPDKALADGEIDL